MVSCPAPHSWLTGRGYSKSKVRTRRRSLQEGPSEAVERISGAWVTVAYYERLGLEPLTGRLLTSDDHRPGARPVAVITDGYGVRRLGRDRKVIGPSLRIEGVPVTIVGVSSNSPAPGRNRGPISRWRSTGCRRSRRVGEPGGSAPTPGCSM